MYRGATKGVYFVPFRDKPTGGGLREQQRVLFRRETVPPLERERELRATGAAEQVRGLVHVLPTPEEVRRTPQFEALKAAAWRRAYGVFHRSLQRPFGEAVGLGDCIDDESKIFSALGQIQDQVQWGVVRVAGRRCLKGAGRGAAERRWRAKVTTLGPRMGGWRTSGRKLGVGFHAVAGSLRVMSFLQ
jgi:hypothetical protein